jgi:signal transduction histidine kinase
MHRERQLIDDAGHDLRTPLAGVRALLETEPDDTEALERNRADALASLARLEATVEDLLVLSQVQRERRVEPVDLDEIVLQEAQLMGHGDGPSIDTSGVSGGQVIGRRSELERMTENLLANGLRHARRAVAVSVQEDDGHVHLVIDDDGPGIPVDDRDRVFERFTRLDASRTAQSGGSGLGLAIVRDVVTAHGGSVSVGEAALGGASFRVVLPAST